MSHYRVLVTDYAWSDLDVERSILAEVDAELVVADSIEEADLVRLAAGVDALMVCWAPATAAVIEACTDCRLVARMGIGLDNIDVEFCTRAGIPVTNVPDYCVLEVAEHALSMMFALARGLPQFHLSSKSGNYDAHVAGDLGRVEGATLGIVGVGRIGSRLAEKAKALGMQVLGCTRSERNLPAGVRAVSLRDLLTSSDYVSLHLPLTSETQTILGQAQFELMRDTAYLINTSRGGLIDHTALADALQAGEIAGAALDVQDPEPPPLNEPPFSDPRVIVTPHVAFVSGHSVLELRRRVATQVADRLRGRRPENVVNPECLAD